MRGETPGRACLLHLRLIQPSCPESPVFIYPAHTCGYELYSLQGAGDPAASCLHGTCISAQKGVEAHLRRRNKTEA